MTKTELITRISEVTGVTKTFAKAALEAVFEGITYALVDNEEVHIPEFGKFVVFKRKASKVRHPSTKELVPTAERVTVKFRPSVSLRKMAGDKVD